jgi:hypothetical protein
VLEEWVLLMPPTIEVADIDGLRNGTDDKKVTEGAAIVVALAQIAAEHRLVVDQVTLVGECGDYWLTTPDGHPAGLLEISGTNDPRASLQSIFESKRIQVLGNSSARALRCYVSVTTFTSLEGVCCCVRG